MNFPKPPFKISVAILVCVLLWRPCGGNPNLKQVSDKSIAHTSNNIPNRTFEAQLLTHRKPLLTIPNNVPQKPAQLLILSVEQESPPAIDEKQPANETSRHLGDHIKPKEPPTIPELMNKESNTTKQIGKAQQNVEIKDHRHLNKGSKNIVKRRRRIRRFPKELESQADHRRHRRNHHRQRYHAQFEERERRLLYLATEKPGKLDVFIVKKNRHQDSGYFIPFIIFLIIAGILLALALLGIAALIICRNRDDMDADEDEEDEGGRYAIDEQRAANTKPERMRSRKVGGGNLKQTPLGLVYDGRGMRDDGGAFVLKQSGPGQKDRSRSRRSPMSVQTAVGPPSATGTDVSFISSPRNSKTSSSEKQMHPPTLRYIPHKVDSRQLDFNRGRDNLIHGAVKVEDLPKLPTSKDEPPLAGRAPDGSSFRIEVDDKTVGGRPNNPNNFYSGVNLNRQKR